MRCAEGSAGLAACRAVMRAGLALANGGRNAGVLSCSLDLYAGLYRDWSLWDLPRWPQVLVVSVIAVYCAAACAAVAVTSVRSGQLRLFGLLVLCAASVELTRGSGQTTEVMWDVYAIWDLPCAVLLPPTYVLLAPVARMALTQDPGR